jgi:hypothetical protein
MRTLAVEARFQHPQAARAGQLCVDQRHQLVPTAKSLGVFVRLVGLHQSIKTSSRQAFHNVVQSAYPEHVAGLGLSWRSRF